MARILYSINGEGRGHSTRSVALIKELEKKHTIKVIVGGKNAYKYIKKYCHGAIRFEGVKLIYKNNTVDNFGTAKHFIKDFIGKYPESVKKIYSVIKKFKPDIVITDFEGTVAFIAKTLGYKVICVCNNHSLTKLKYNYPIKYRKDRNQTILITKAIFPKVDYHLITTFFYLPVKKDNVSLYPPILRKEVTQLKPVMGKYVLVYQTSDTNSKLLDILKTINCKFIIYGFNISKREGNLLFRKFDDKKILKDMQGCKAVIANGGYSLISEAVSLHKPILSIPIKGQFEQILNALQIKRLGYGEFHEEADHKKIVTFIKNINKYHDNLKKFKREDNSRILAKIEEIIAKECSS